MVLPQENAGNPKAKSAIMNRDPARGANSMKKTTLAIVCLALMPVLRLNAATPHPAASISNGKIKATLYLPDATNGFYRGTRFDWSGIVSSLEFAGHRYYGPWFQRFNPAVSDYVYDGGDIVAGACSAIMGVPEEFTASPDNLPLGWKEAPVGGTFVKIGVGALRKPDNQPYSNYRLYEIANGGQRTVRKTASSVEFTQALSDPGSGYGYVYTKRVSLTPGKPQMTIEHTLRNTGKRTIRTSVYDHNFTSIDRLAPGPGLSIRFGFDARPVQPFGAMPLEMKDGRLLFTRVLTGEDKVADLFQGFGASARDYNIRIEDRRAGAGVHITGDRPLVKVNLWGIRTVIAPEPFIGMTIAPGAEFTWKIVYDYYTLAKDAQ